MFSNKAVRKQRPWVQEVGESQVRIVRYLPYLQMIFKSSSYVFSYFALSLRITSSVRGRVRRGMTAVKLKRSKTDSFGITASRLLPKRHPFRGNFFWKADDHGFGHMFPLVQCLQTYEILRHFVKSYGVFFSVLLCSFAE